VGLTALLRHTKLSTKCWAGST